MNNQARGNRAQFLLALWVGKACAAVIGRIAPERGSNISGEIALKIAPGLLGGFTGADPDKTILITGTNGKSTSNNLIIHLFRTAGRSVCANIEGANLITGVCTALLKRSALSGRLKDEWVILEVDERSLASVLKAIPARRLCVTNIQKDQVQRNGDPDYIYEKIRAAISPGMTLYLNNDEPRSKSLERFAARAVRFGVAPFGPANNLANNADDGVDSPANNSGSEGSPANNAGGADGLAVGMPDGWRVTMPCPVCHDALRFTQTNLAGVGTYHCPACGFSNDPVPDCLIAEADFEQGTFRVGEETYPLAYTAPFFLYNYALCAAVAEETGLGAGILRRALDSFTNIGGRVEAFQYAGKTVQYIRIKQENPETLQSALDVIAADRRIKDFFIGLDVVDDIIPNYSNTFYAFDCDFDAFAASGIERCVCFSHTVCFDMANRLRYAGIPDDRIEALNTDDEEEILARIRACEAPVVYLITWIKKYEKLRAHAAAGVSA
ncbi:MAG: MurT ligase domain-containing protein [Clostridiales bacterium]|nr:MurT ligase domain-containing protein [Clostridiales bacterium]